MTDDRQYHSFHKALFMIRRFLVFLLLAAPIEAKAIEFDRIVIDDNFPGAYQVEVADVNGDKKPDVIVVGGGTCAWYENPNWKKRIVTTPKETPGIISSATADLDNDGHAEIAIAYEFSMNEPSQGKLGLAVQGKSVDDPWNVVPVIVKPKPSKPLGTTTVEGVEKGVAKKNLVPEDSLPPETLGSIHRLRWGTFLHVLTKAAEDGSKFEKERILVVAPIFGPSAKPPAFEAESSHLFFYDLGPEPKSGHWEGGHRINDFPILHAIEVTDLDNDGISDVLTASNRGVSWSHMFGFMGYWQFNTDIFAPGAPGEAPEKGASEVHVGKLKYGRRFLATVEPWHGTDVAVYLEDKPKALKFGARNVIDTTLKEGHALWVADVDGDGDDEVFAGYRGPGTSVLLYDYDGKNWTRTVVDTKIAAQDLRGGDLDGDGKPDVVAVGGSTHNVVWYRPKSQ